MKPQLRKKDYTGNRKSGQNSKPMKIRNSPWKMSAVLAAVALAFVGAVSTVNAASIALNGQVALRPLTPGEISSTYGYSLTNAQFSAGIGTVALGEPVYLDAMVTASIAPSNIVGVIWALTNKPMGSLAALTNSPLGTNVPLFKTGDRVTGGASGTPSPYLQLAGPSGRTFFRPDFVGQYTVLATITTTGVLNGTNIVPVTTNIATTITASTYYGLATCEACHSGGVLNAPVIYPTYTNTPHASFFTRAIDGLVSSHYSKNCIQCHTLGYDTNSFAVNGGFDDIATLYGWTFPTVLTNNPSNWAAMPAALQNLANIQCENCHGPGSQHPVANGIVGNTNFISVSFGAGVCSQCHDSLPAEYQSAEWNNSLHASSARETSAACVRCHTAPGFVGWATAGGMSAQNLYPTNVISANSFSTNILTTSPNTTYEAITCQACHDPHNDANPHELRLGYNVTLSDGTVVTNAGAGGFCMECHNNRNGSVTNMLAEYPLNQPNWAGGVGFGTHDSPQADMLEGVNAVTYGKVIPSAPHANVVPDTCVGCHMQPTTNTPAFSLAGGHTFKMSYTNSLGAKIPVTAVCTQCHGAITNFDFPVADYNGDGVVEGVQTEVHHLLDKLSTLMPPRVYQANPANYVADGLVKASDRNMANYTNMPARFLNAYYNWDFVYYDASFGVHNAPFAVGLLKASIADLTGDGNGDGLPDAWQISYFGSNYVSNAQAGPNAINNSAGFPNWMMYALGLDPHSTPVVAGSGVVFFNGNEIVNGATNTIAIYTAAEVAFDTQVGTSYQIQGISALTGSWQNISTNIPGTGGSISYVTPTRNNAQMFFRVVHTP
jgi:Doubled CXXCH motif (Paired_CXXCH_1)